MDRSSAYSPRNPFAVLDGVSGRRRETLAMLINLIAAQGPVTRANAMSELNWSRALVTRAASELLQEGVLTEIVPDAPARRGRPTALLKLVVGSAATIGIDFGFRSVRTILASVDHTLLGSDERQLSRDYGPDEGLRAAREMLDASMGAAGITWADVVGAGIAISGPIDYANNAASLQSLLPHWEGDIVARARTYLPCAITLGNDTRLACYAELLWGAGRGFENFLYFKLHSGVGGTYVLNRKIVTGATGAAGEFGHMTVDPTGEICRCGGRGCLETVVGVPAIVRRLRPAYGHDPEWGEILLNLQAGDPPTVRAFSDAYEVIGRATASLCNILNPQAVILGGALSRASDRIDRVVADGVAHNALSISADTPVVLGALGRNAAALGAVGAVLMKGVV